jgi:argininosuccinate synthase
MSKKVVLAFSGGLDTSWCVPHLIDQGYEVITATIDVGGFSSRDADDLAIRSKALGAVDHVHIHAKDAYYQEVVRFLIFGNVTRGGGYPLCVGAERSIQARESALVAQKIGAKAVAHGCTAAGNDQIRFEVTTRAVAPELTILAPVRDEAPARPDQVKLLSDRNLPLPPHGAAYSVNTGLWGITIGGVETTKTEGSIPESEWIRTKGAFDRLETPRLLKIGFRKGEPSHLDGVEMDSVKLIEALDGIAGKFGIGRGIHLGETILGIKGRVAYEAPAAFVILAAHRELEKLTLTKRQTQLKDLVSQSYGEMVHEGLFTEPACRDLEALLLSSQARVTGEVRVLLRTGSAFVEGSTSPHSLHAASRAVYGEAVGEWTPEDAKGFCRIYGLPSILHARAGGNK